MDKQDDDKRILRDYERPEDRIPHEGKMETDPGEPRGASNQQLDMGSARKKD